MPAFHPRIRAVMVAVAAIALLAVAVGGTVASSNPATVYACYDVYGNVRMGDAAVCKLPGGGRLVSWATTGVPGPTGTTGPQGATGPAGPTGPAGAGTSASVLTFVGFGASTTVFTDSRVIVSLRCGATTGVVPGVEVQNTGTTPVTFGFAGGNLPTTILQVAPGTSEIYGTVSTTPPVEAWVADDTGGFSTTFIASRTVTGCTLVYTH
jgi:hypothetical protein